MHKIGYLIRFCVFLAIVFSTQFQARNFKNNPLIQKYMEQGEINKIQVLMESEKQNPTPNELVGRLKNSSLLTAAERTVYEDMIRDISARKAKEVIKAIKNKSLSKKVESKSEYLKKAQTTDFLLTEYEFFIDFGGGGWHTLDKYNYDNNQNMIQWVQQYYNDSTASWVNGNLMMYLYDSFNRDTLEVNQGWDMDSQSWVDYAKWSNIYNANNNISESRFFGWANPEWLLGWRYLYTYDANNNTLEELTQEWTDPSWSNTYRLAYTFDSNNNLLSDISYNWEGTNWKETFKTENTYDASNNLISSSFILLGEYISKDIYTYDSNNNQTSDTNYSWNGTSWVINFILTSTYDANNNQTDYLIKQSNGSRIVDYLKYDATFNASNEIISWRSYTRETNSWVPNSKGAYTYDADHNLISYSDSYTRNGGLKWLLFLREAWTWSQAVTEVEDITSLPSDYQLSQNYPNPFNPSSKINFTIPERANVSLRVFDLLGREVTTLVNGDMEAGIHEIEFNADNLPSGVYFYKIQTGSFNNTKKMILLR